MFVNFRKLIHMNGLRLHVNWTWYVRVKLASWCYGNPKLNVNVVNWTCLTSSKRPSNMWVARTKVKTWKARVKFIVYDTKIIQVETCLYNTPETRLSTLENPYTYIVCDTNFQKHTHTPMVKHTVIIISTCVKTLVILVCEPQTFKSKQTCTTHPKSWYFGSPNLTVNIVIWTCLSNFKRPSIIWVASVSKKREKRVSSLSFVTTK